MSEQVEVAPQVTIENDTLTVTVERQVALYGDHTTVRAHVSTGFAPAGDETVEVYQARIRGAVSTLATPLKVAVLSELGLDFEVVDGIVLETVATQTDGEEQRAERVKQVTSEFTQEYPSPLPVKEWVEEAGRNKLVPKRGSNPTWVQDAAAQYPWAVEIIYGQRRDGKGDYYKASDGQRNGKSEFLNPPKAGDRVPYPRDLDTEPF